MLLKRVYRFRILKTLDDIDFGKAEVHKSDVGMEIWFEMQWMAVAPH